MTRTTRWIPLLALLLCAGVVGVLEYLPWREKNPLRFHMEPPPSEDSARKRTPVELWVENTSNYPVVYYGGSIQSGSKPIAHFCQLRGSVGNGVVIPAGGAYTHHHELTGQALGVVRNSKTEMRYYWAPKREAWVARTFLPALKSRLPSKWAGAIPDILRRREQEPLEVLQAAKGESS